MNFRAFEQMIKEGQAIRRQREEQQVRDGTFFPRPAVEFNPFSGEQIIDVPEEDSLRLAREARWGTCVANRAVGLIGNADVDVSDTDSNPAVTTSGSDTDSTGGDTFTHHVEENAGSDSESAGSYILEDDFATHLVEAANSLPPVAEALVTSDLTVSNVGWTSINIMEEDKEEAPIAAQSEHEAPPLPTPFYGSDFVSPTPTPGDSAIDLFELD